MRPPADPRGNPMRAAVLLLVVAALVPAAPSATAKQEVGTACSVAPGETTCVFLCVPAALAVTADGPAPTSVTATCGTTSLGCTVVGGARCWALTTHGALGYGLCRTNGLGEAVCGSA